MTQEPNIIDEYMDLTKEYEKKYGKRTIVLLQVGAFFEVYGLKTPTNGEITGSNIEEFAAISQLNISEKKLVHKGHQVVMAGFRDYTLDKYLQRITDNDYNGVVYVQEKTGKVMKRVFHGVYSPGTHISYDTDSSPQITNNIMCIWIDRFTSLAKKNMIVYGVACTNIFTGKSSMFEYETQFLMNPTTFDELERFVSVSCPSEVIFLSSLDEATNNTIIQYVGIKTNSIHRIESSRLEAQNCMKQKYIKHILSTFFGEEAYEVCKEFENNVMSTQAFCYLLNFIQEHNPNLVKNITLPVFYNTSDNMLLANHTLKQLNIIDDNSLDGKKTGHLSSVLSFLNKCSSAMGRRMFQQQLLNPTINPTWLNCEYDMISHLIQNPEVVDMFRKKLAKIRDFEKLCRQIVVRKLYPSSIYHLCESIRAVQQMTTCIFEDRALCEYLCGGIKLGSEAPNTHIERVCENMIALFENIFHLETCKTTNSMNTFDENIIRPGVCAELDAVVQNYNDKMRLIHDVRTELNALMNNHSQKSDDVEYVKIHETEKSGLSLQITKTRSKLLKTIISSGSAHLISSKIAGFNYKDCAFSSASTNADEISIPALNKAAKDLLIHKEQMNSLIAKFYMDFLADFENKWLNHLENLSTYTAKIDVIQCKTHLAMVNNYCRPEIIQQYPEGTQKNYNSFSPRNPITEKGKEFEYPEGAGGGKGYRGNEVASTLRREAPFREPGVPPKIMDTGSSRSQVAVKHLRHCLIEQLQQNEVYVTNDIELGTQINGLLLYGTNAVGKTSFIRALGIAIIMAQSGLFVPCSEFKYVPYRAIFSRILGNDNIFKGLSTFAVEMSELRIILKMADENSLILGDELCSGTESESALSIFVAGLQELHEKAATFIFATHFHEIVNYDEVKALHKLALKHMAVIYDRERDCLVYDRKLKDGAGTSTYGLEVCKSLYLTDDFLNKAYAIRNKYFPEMKGELSQTTTRFNALKIRGKCEHCKAAIGEEVHHIDPQKNADKNGFLGTFHKNHPGNLLTVCGKCHDLLHDVAVPMKKKKTTKGSLLVAH
jgi:DNA mismatch repair protein MutS